MSDETLNNKRGVTKRVFIVNNGVEETIDNEHGCTQRVFVVNPGGGDSHNLGWYETLTALNTAHPTAEAGDWAIVGSTDTVWVWDTDTSAWVDTDTKGEVTPDMIIVKSATMPSGSTVPAGAIYQYTGTTNATYTHGYIYENVTTTTSSSASATQTVGSGLSNILVDIDTLESFTGWTTDNSLQIFYTADGWSVDTTSLGVTYTGTPSVGDAITITYTAEVNTYAWTRIDVQPTPNELPDQTGKNGKYLQTNGTTVSWESVESLPSQTGQSGKFLTTDGTDASWGTIPIEVNTSNGSLKIASSYNLPNNYANIMIGTGARTDNTSGNIAIGRYANAEKGSVCIGNSDAWGTNSIAILGRVEAGAKYAIQLGKSVNITTNSDANTFKVANENGNFELMNANGNLPADRLASTSGLADGNYRLRLTMSSGTPTLSWVAE